jgi:hypothetical protein
VGAASPHVALLDGRERQARGKGPSGPFPRAHRRDTVVGTLHTTGCGVSHKARTPVPVPPLARRHGVAEPDHGLGRIGARVGDDGADGRREWRPQEQPIQATSIAANSFEVLSDPGRVDQEPDR